MTDEVQAGAEVGGGVASVTLPPEPASAGAARRFVVDRVGAVDADLADAAALLTTELATNAILHAATNFSVRVDITEGRVRVDLTDESPLLPVRRRFSAAAGTGRGLQLVEAMSARWGVEPAPVGKTVFFEVDSSSAPAAPVVDLNIDDWPDLAPPARADAVVQVCLVGLPVVLEHQASEHFAELFREFALIAERQPELRAQLPGRLLELIEELTSQFGGFTNGQQAAIADAYDQGQPSVDVEYWVPPAAGAAAARLDRLLDDADEYCRTGDALLTLASPPEVVRYRRWYCGQFTDQCAGGSPTSWPDWSA